MIMADLKTFVIFGFIQIKATTCSPFAYDREYGHGPAGVGVVTILSTLLTCCCCIICYAACISWCVTANRDNDDDRNVIHVIHSPPPQSPVANRSVSPRGPVVVKVTEYHIGNDDGQTIQRSKEQQKVEKPEDSFKTSTSDSKSSNPAITGTENSNPGAESKEKRNES